MVICKYYLSGSCWYGNRCHNDHIDLNRRPSVLSSSNSARVNEPVIDRNRFQWIAPTQRTARDHPGSSADHYDFRSALRNDQARAVTPDTPGEQRKNSSGAVTDEQSLLNRVQSDLNEWRQSAQWPFSSYGLKGYECVFGFKDLSFEELRLKAYVARSNGTMSTYETEVKNLINAVRMRWTQLLALTPENTKEMLAVLRPYIASPSSATALARRQSDTSGNAPSFSFKLDNPPSTTSTIQGIAENVAKPEGSSKPSFSFKLPSSTASSAPSSSVPPSSAPQASKTATTFSFKVPTTSAAVLKESQVQNVVYSDMKSLTPEEKQAFLASEFLSYADIPLRPPPKELC